MPTNSNRRQRAAKGQRPLPPIQERKNAQGKVTSFWVWVPTFTRDGKPDRERVAGKTIELLRQNYEQWFIDNPDPSLAPTGSVTIGDFGRWWIPEILARGNPSTFVNYRGAFENHICHPDYGCDFLVLGNTSKPELKCNAENLAAWVRRMDRYGVPKPTQVVVIKVMRSMGACMAENPGRSGVRINPAMHLDYPKGGHNTKRGKTRHKANPQDTQRMLQSMQDVLPEHLSALWVVILGLGLRRGEVCGLKWSDIEGNKVTINRQVSALDRQLHYRLPKCVEEGDEPEVLEIPAAVVEALRVQRKAQLELQLRTRSWGKSKDPQRQAGDWVFTEDGCVLRPSRLELLFNKVRVHAGLLSKTLHKGRHDCATFLVMLGCSPDEIRRTMRHKDQQTVFRYYIDDVEHENTSARRMDQLFGQLAEPAQVAV